MVFKTIYHFMQVKRIAECSKGSILQYFRPSLSYHLSLRSLFCLFLSGRLRQVLLYRQISCGICSSEIANFSRCATSCSKYGQWSHKSCLDMDTATYDHLADTTDSWFCSSCGSPNNATVLYDIPTTMAESIGSVVYSSNTDDAYSTPRHLV